MANPVGKVLDWLRAGYPDGVPPRDYFPLIALLRRHHDVPSVFKSPGPTPVVAALLCLFLAGPWVDRDVVQYKIAGGLLLIGVVLWVITFAINKATGVGGSDFDDVSKLEG